MYEYQRYAYEKGHMLPKSHRILTFQPISTCSHNKRAWQLKDGPAGHLADSQVTSQGFPYNKLPHLTVAAWNPHCASEVLGSGVAELWSEICCDAFCTACAEAIAVWFFDPFTRCVDDMLLVRRLPPFASAWTVWQTFACLCGWQVPLAKSPFPSPELRDLGAWFNLSPWQQRCCMMSVANERNEQLRKHRLFPGNLTSPVTCGALNAQTLILPPVFSK